MNGGFRILIADDERLFSDRTADILKQEGYQVLIASSGTDALEKIRSEKPDILLLDIELGDMHGRDVLKTVRAEQPDCQVIIVSGLASGPVVAELLRNGALDFLEKPVEPDLLLARVRLAARMASLDREASYLDEEYANLKNLKEFGENIVRHLPMGLLHINQKGKISVCNAMAEKILCRTASDLSGLSLAETVQDRFSEPERLEEAVAGLSGPEDGFDFVMLNNRRGEETFHLRLAGRRSPDGVLLFMTDITGDYKIRQNLVQREKQATLGEFIATITHGLGNNMMNIIANASGIQEELEHLAEKITACEEAAASGDAGQISRAKEELLLLRKELLDYGSRLVRRSFEMDRNIKSLLEYGRQQTNEREAVQINTLMDDAAAIVQSCPQASRILWNRMLAPDLPSLQANPHRLKDALVDLLLNAVQSIPESGSVEYATALEDRSIHIRIRDTGVGIPPERHNMMFKAFYTTKKSGTGLGLANVKNVVKQHNGDVSFESAPGQGTLFRIRLPVH